jgi:hypothetical protein
LRLVISQRSPEERDRMRDQAYTKTWSAEELTEDENAIMRLLIGAWTDGALTALRAAKEETDA